MKANRRNFLMKAGGAAAILTVGTQCDKHDHPIVINTCCNDAGPQTADVLRLSVENDCTRLTPAHGLRLLKSKQRAFAILAEGVPVGGVTVNLNMTNVELDFLFKVHPPPPTFTLTEGQAALFILNEDIGIQPRPNNFGDTDSQHSVAGQFIYEPGRCTGGSDHVDYHIEC